MKAFLLCLAVIAALTSGCQRRPPGDVILVVIDTLRADHLPMYGYQRGTAPNLVALARDGVVYRNAISPGTWTVPAHGSLFTGRWPSYHGAERVPSTKNLALALNENQPCLAEILRERGYRTAAFVGNGAYVAEIFGFGRGFAEYFATDLNAPVKLREAVNAWLPKRHEDEQQNERLFLFLNILDPHEPYEPPAPLDALFPAKVPALGAMMTTTVYAGTPITAELREHFISQYDGEIVLADRELGKIFERLKDLGRYDDALIIVTSDHGEFLGEHGLAGHGVAPYEPELRVPLIVKLPQRQRAGEHVHRRVSTIGVFSTVLAHVGKRQAADVESRSLDEPHPVWVEDISYAGERIRVGYDGDYKLITTTAPDGTATTTLFDLGIDPGEETPITDPNGAAALRSALAAFSGAPRPVNATKKPVIDPERDARLRALGYVD